MPIEADFVIQIETGKYVRYWLWPDGTMRPDLSVEDMPFDNE